MDHVLEGNYTPELDHWDATTRSFEAFSRSQLSGTTCVKHGTYSAGSPVDLADLTSPTEIKSLVRSISAGRLNNWTNSRQKIPKTGPLYDIYFIHKHLVSNTQEQVPEDANRLRISAASFEALAKRLLLPPAFVFALSRHYLPNGRGSRSIQIKPRTAVDFWYLLPIRVQVECSTISSRNPAGNQMNPFHKLHLPGVNLDIRRSCVGVFCRVDTHTKRVVFVTFDFMHGRWPKVAMEPSRRIDEAMKRRGNAPYGHGYFFHLVYLSSAVRWWTNSLNSVNEQLIIYELNLQTELSGQHTTPEQVFADLNRALHSVAAHLHRYLSELKSLQGILIDLSAHYEFHHTNEIASGDLDSYEHASRGFSLILSQVEALYDFATELEKKIQNNLALLFNRMQINSDRRLVANGQAMQAILSGMQEDASLGRKLAKASHDLAQDMRRDSVAMRTIAVVTMFFLPGATFATFLSMPFFDRDNYLSKTQHFWIWAVMTVPSTAACFVFYWHWTSQARRSSVNDSIPLQDVP